MHQTLCDDHPLELSRTDDSNERLNLAFVADVTELKFWCALLSQALSAQIQLSFRLHLFSKNLSLL